MIKTEQEEKDTLVKVVIPDHIAKMVDFIPVRKYQELFGESKFAIDNRIRRGHWRKGLEYEVPKGGGLWISIKGVNAWCRSTPS